MLDENTEQSGTAAELPPAEEASTGRSLTAEMCRNHGAKVATAICGKCSAPICMTCAFELPTVGTLCPACATTRPDPMPPKRRQARLTSYIMAAFASVVLAIIMSGVFAPTNVNSEADLEGYFAVVGMAMLIFILAPSIIGVSFGVGALSKRLGNPASLIGAIVWNALIIGIWILFWLIGILSE